jgi:ABC-type uncharacterized transport system ATPase subunit
MVIDGALSDVKARLNDENTLEVSFEGDCPVLSIDRAVVTQTETGSYCIRFNPLETTAAEIIQKLLSFGTIRQLSFKDSDMDSIIGRLFRSL